MKEKWLSFINWMNEKGLPVPVCRDPKTGQASVSLTLVVVSAFYVQVGILNSIANVFKGVDMQSALYWFGMCSALYFGRKISGDGKVIKIDKGNEDV